MFKSLMVKMAVGDYWQLERDVPLQLLSTRPLSHICLYDFEQTLSELIKDSKLSILLLKVYMHKNLKQEKIIIFACLHVFN